MNEKRPNVQITEAQWKVIKRTGTYRLCFWLVLPITAVICGVIAGVLDIDLSGGVMFASFVISYIVASMVAIAVCEKHIRDGVMTLPKVEDQKPSDSQ